MSEEDNGLGFDIIIASVDDIETNDYNPNVMEQEVFSTLAEHIKSDGKMVQPVLVRENPLEDGPSYMVVDGEHRFRASKLAGMKEIAVIVVDYTEDEAKFKTIAMNQLRGNYIPLKMAKLLVDLQERYNNTDIKRLTGIDADEMLSLTELLEVPDIDFGNTPVISLDSVERPIQISLMLMPDEISEYSEAMTKAMELGGDSITPLVGEEVSQYDYAMTTSMGLVGVMLRNVGLSTICKVFNSLPKEQKEALVLEHKPELKQDPDK